MVATDEERRPVEDVILRWRGAKKAEVEGIRGGTIRLKSMRYNPKAELKPMPGLRPDRRRAEEGRGAFLTKGVSDEEDAVEENEESAGEEERKDGERRGRDIVLGYSCHAG